MIRIGIIGTGLIAQEHAKSLRIAGGEMSLTAVADIDSARLASFCESYGVSKHYSTAKDLIADPEIDLVAITTPPSAHEEAVVLALEAGKYVLCEKPMAHSLESAARIMKADRQFPGRLSISHQLRFVPAFRKLQWLVKEGSLGALELGTIERHSQVPSSAAAASWWGSLGVAGGGALITQMIHELDLMILLLGRPKSVKATMDRRFTKIESEDLVDGEIMFEGGQMMRCCGTVNSSGLAGRFRVEGSNGSVEFGGAFRHKNSEGQKTWTKLLEQKFPSNKASFVKRICGAFLGRGSAPHGELPAHTLLYREIATAIKNRQALPIGASEAMVSFEVVMAMYQSAILGKEVALPLVAVPEVFSGITTRTFDERKCQTNLATPVFIPSRGDPPPSTWLRDLVVTGLAHFGASTETVKALLRKPPAVHGGPVTRRMPWPRRRHIGRDEERAVKNLFKQERLFGGAVIYAGREETAYCEEFASFLGGGYADAVNSGS
ncbi:MAG: Gfo/Idh/MocA family oxidoreductase, partial [Verrucomicrobia bacterium]|nr:Gfo/Idh/MocA family oxidoreductase [Verrucomicrobiota bacterium]